MHVVNFTATLVVSADKLYLLLQFPYQSLLEGNRYLIKQQDAANLRPPSDSTIPELKWVHISKSLGTFILL